MVKDNDLKVHSKYLTSKGKRFDIYFALVPSEKLQKRINKFEENNGYLWSLIW